MKYNKIIEYFQKKYFLIFLLPIFLIFFLSNIANAITSGNPGKDGPGGSIAGIVNTYYPGSTSVSAGATSITIGASRGATTPIAIGDLLLVMQMQDATINNNNSTAYGANNGTGSGSTSTGNSGYYEYVLAMSAVTTSGGTVTIQGSGTGNGLLYAYTNTAYSNTTGQHRFQVIRVPQYSSATLTSSLTAAQWNGATGGVLACDVAGPLALGGASVSVTGLGFRGGGGRGLTGDTSGADTDYRTVATKAYNGSKAEGIAGTPRYVYDGTSVVDTGVEGYPNGSYARGAPGNAGGGGTDGNQSANDENSGGGGGGNVGAGGTGGNTWSSNLDRGGKGGAAFSATAGKIIMGGGGGAGTRNNSSGLVSSGGLGGGIVLIRAGDVSGTGIISANGTEGTTPENDAGGGGGAGGSIVFYSVSGSVGSLTLNANGGNGGNADIGGDAHGPGGGGGGGFIATNGSATLNADNGLRGYTVTTTNYYNATSGTVGSELSNLIASQMPGIIAVSTPKFPNITVTKTTSTPNVTNTSSGATARYTIAVVNNNDIGMAQQATISDLLPTGFTYSSLVSATTTGTASRTTTVNPTAGDTNPQFGIWDIPRNSSVTIIFNVAIASTVPSGTYQNPATITYLNPQRLTNSEYVSTNYDYLNNTGEDIKITAGISVSGYVYNDVNKDSAKGTGEVGTGQTIYVKLCQDSGGGTYVVKSIATVNTSTGYYEFPNVYAGTYRLVESNNNDATPTPLDPTNWSSSSPTTNYLALTVASTAIVNQNFGDYFDVSVNLSTTGTTTKTSCKNTTVLYTPITVKNNSANFSDTIDITAISSQGWKLELLNAAGSTVLATDNTGDGTWDVLSSGVDTNSNSKPDTGVLVKQTSVNYQIRVTVPASATANATDTTTITIKSSNDNTVTATLALATTAINCNNISGYVYNDVNKNASKDASETGTAQTLYVKLCQSGVVKSVATVNPSTGAYQFTTITDGSYTLVESTNNNTTSTTASDPTNWSSSTANTISITVAGADIINQNFGDYFDVSVQLSASPNNQNICIGANSSYPITIKNNSANFSDTIDITASSTKGWKIELLNSAGSTVLATDNTGDGTWDVITSGADTNSNSKPDTGSISAQASVNYQIRITAPQGTAKNLVDTTSILIQSSRDSSVTATQVLSSTSMDCSSLSVTKTSNTDNPSPGEIIEYTVTVSNTGASDSTNVVVTDVMPDNTSYTAGTILINGTSKTDIVDADTANYNSTSKTLTANLGTITKGSVVTLKFKVQVSSLATNINITNNAIVTADNLTQPIIASKLIRSASLLNFFPNNSDSTSAGGVIYYTHEVVAYTPGIVTLSSTSTKNWSYTIYKDVNGNLQLDPADTVYNSPISLGDVYNDNISHSIKLIVKVQTPTNQALGSVDLFQITANLTPTDISKPSKSLVVNDMTTISNSGFLKLIKSVSPTGYQAPNTLLTYRIIYTNMGATLLRNINIRDVIPNSTTYVSSRFVNGSGTVTGPSSSREIVWNVTGNLLPGGSGEVEFIVRIN